ncbi:MAG: hypothetical protein NTX49_06925 [Chlamydiae bacterium]|nr:hypothetical protein [Chlamydiota bacterium]
MTFVFTSMTDSQLHQQYESLSKILAREKTWMAILPECQIEGIETDLSFIESIIQARTISAATRALVTSAAGASAGRDVSVSPCFPSPRTTSGSIERRGASTQRSSAARLDTGSGLSSPPKTAREAALSTVDESDILVVSSSGSNAVIVHAEHVRTPATGDGSSIYEALARSASSSVAPTTPLSIDPMHSAFARAISSPGTPSGLSRSSVHSSLPRVISSLRLDGEASDLLVFEGPGRVMPELAAPAYEMPDPASEFCIEPRNRRRRGSASVIAVEFASYRASPVGDFVTEAELAEEKRREDESAASFAGIDCLNGNWLFRQVKGNPHWR